MSEKIDPKGIDFNSFLDRLGCFRCEKKNNGFGSWLSKKAMYECDRRKTEARRAYKSGTPLEPFYCEYKIIGTPKTPSPSVV
jgi:hypothetical protein